MCFIHRLFQKKFKDAHTHSLKSVDLFSVILLCPQIRFHDFHALIICNLITDDLFLLVVAE